MFVWVNEWHNKRGGERKFRFQPCLRGCVFVCQAALRQALSTAEEGFCFSTVLIPHSDHSSSACTRETNNTSDMSFRTKTWCSSPSFPLTALCTHCFARCVYVTALSYGCSQSAGLSGADLIDPVSSLYAIR